MNNYNDKFCYYETITETNQNKITYTTNPNHKESTAEQLRKAHKNCFPTTTTTSTTTSSSSPQTHSSGMDNTVFQQQQQQQHHHHHHHHLHKHTPVAWTTCPGSAIPTKSPSQRKTTLRGVRPTGTVPGCVG